MVQLRNTRAELYTRFQGMAVSVSRKIAERFNRPYHEMEEEALSHLGHICAKWEDPNNRSRFKKGKKVQPQTWIYQCLYWHLWIYAEKEAGRKQVELKEADGKVQKVGWREAIFQEVSAEGQALLRVLFEAPGEVAEALWSVEPQRTVTLMGKTVPVEVKTPRLRLARAEAKGLEVVATYLQEEHGWTEALFEKAWRDVVSCVEV